MIKMAVATKDFDVLYKVADEYFHRHRGEKKQDFYTFGRSKKQIFCRLFLH